MNAMYQMQVCSLYVFLERDVHFASCSPFYKLHFVLSLLKLETFLPVKYSEGLMMFLTAFVFSCRVT